VQFPKKSEGPGKQDGREECVWKKASLNMNLMTSLAHGKTERNAGEDHVFIRIWDKCKWSKGTIYYQYQLGWR
jgi:hypothetical protein